MFSKLKQEKNLRNVAKSFYIFLTTLDEVEKYAKMIESNASDKCVHHYIVEILNLFDPELQLINTKPMIKDKFKKLVREFRQH